MDDYISKPVRVGELQASIEHWGPLRPKRTDTSFLARSRPGVSAAPSPDDALLDSNVIADLRAMLPSEGVGMLEELIGLFLESAPQRLTELEDSITDPVRLAFHAHSLKSMSLNLGARRLVELCQKLEDLARANSLQTAPALLQELHVAYAQTRAQLLPLRPHS
jgi:HPt (histidine-containing phosphotransfer) domain-containing protein